MKKVFILMILILSILLITGTILYEQKIDNIKKECESKNKQIQLLKEKNKELEKNLESAYNNWYVRFYEDFHNEVGAFE